MKLSKSTIVVLLAFLFLCGATFAGDRVFSGLVTADDLTAVDDVTAGDDLIINGSDLNMPDSGRMTWGTRGSLQWVGTREFRIMNYNRTEGIRIDVNTNNVLALEAFDGSDAAIFSSNSINAGGIFNAPNGTDLPATCVVGDVFHDTNDDACADADTGDGVVCICKTTDTWVVVQDI